MNLTAHDREPIADRNFDEPSTRELLNAVAIGCLVLSAVLFFPWVLTLIS
ncbi:hypothetical protein GS489_00185 [Rhodococcus hoagii]|nr:hypothetical protein [Prescottella equi]